MQTSEKYTNNWLHRKVPSIPDEVFRYSYEKPSIVNVIRSVRVDLILINLPIE